MLTKIFDLLGEFLTWYFVLRKKSNALEGSTLVKEVKVEVVKEVQKHNLPIPFQPFFKEKNETLKKFGCYFLCINFLAEVAKEVKFGVEKCFDTEEMILMFSGFPKEAVNKQVAFVESPNLIFKALGLEREIKFIENHFSPNYLAKENEFLIGRFKAGESFHFVILDEKKSLLWDSLIDSNAVQNGELDSIRVFEVSSPDLAKSMKERLQNYKEQFEKIKEA